MALRSNVSDRRTENGARNSGARKHWTFEYRANGERHRRCQASCSRYASEGSRSPLENVLCNDELLDFACAIENAKCSDVPVEALDSNTFDHAEPPEYL
jgi:hypothetical protein